MTSDMNQEFIDYQKVADAIAFLSNNFKAQPSLEAVAQHVHTSPQHFQRIFTEWAGVSPKKFTQYLTIDYLRHKIQEANNLQNAADMAGLSTQSRVYDLFTTIEAVTPQEFKTNGKGLDIDYGFHETTFGKCLIALTARGICYLAFTDATTQQTEFDRFVDTWHFAKRHHNPQNTEGVVHQIFNRKKADKIHLLVQGTNFQLKVWEALLRVPQGAVSTYQHIANAIEHPKAVRAVGTAIGNNPIAFLIPCHRVIKAQGDIGQYHWGSTRKKALIGWEMARSEQ
jgi:AraC family transcriptional regulator, regulatory protein of adaptative response / methylated-DNA-[protein]-cysteine methyltransferase